MADPVLAYLGAVLAFLVATILVLVAFSGVPPERPLAARTAPVFRGGRVAQLVGLAATDPARYDAAVRALVNTEVAQGTRGRDWVELPPVVVHCVEGRPWTSWRREAARAAWAGPTPFFFAWTWTMLSPRRREAQRSLYVRELSEAVLRTVRT